MAQTFSSYPACEDTIDYAYEENDRINDNLNEIQNLKDKIAQNSIQNLNTPRLTRFINKKHKMSIARMNRENRLLMTTKYTIDDIEESSN